MRFEKLQGLDSIQQQYFDQLKQNYLSVSEGVDPVTKQIIYVDCTVAGETYRMNAGRKAAETHDAGVRLAEESGEAETFVVDYYNQVHYSVPLPVAKQIAKQQALDARNHYIQYQQLKQQIANAQSVTEVREVDLNFTVNTE